MTLHKDLADAYRQELEDHIWQLAEWLHREGQSLAIAREAIFDMWDKAAAELSA
jgi:hypothetical protein